MTTPPERTLRDSLPGQLALLFGRCLLAAASLAAVTALASAPVGWCWLQWFGLTGFLLALEGTGKRAAVLVGFCAGLGANVSLFTWLVGASATYGELPVAAAWAAFAVLAAYLSLQHAAVALIDARVRERAPAARWYMFPAAWVLLEWLWPRLFPWHLSTPQVGSPSVAMLAPIGGPLLISTVIVAVNLALYESLRWLARRGPKPRGSLGLAVAGLLLVAVAALRAPTAQDESSGIAVGWVQPGVVLTPVNGVTDAQVWQAMLAGAPRCADPSGQDVVSRILPPEPLGFTVYPEGIFPWLFADPQSPAGDASRGQILRLDREVRLERQQLWRLARAARSPILVGATVHYLRAGPSDWETLERRNALLEVTPTAGYVGRYDKRRLLPLAEDLPLEETFPALREAMPFAGRMKPGNGPRRLEVGGLRVGPLICFEGVWSQALREELEEGPVDLFVNATNDTWFPGQGPYLHDMIVQMRGIESGRPLLRVTTDGLSSITYPWGETRILGKRHEAASGVVRVVPSANGLTPYMQTGDAPWGGVALLLVLGFAWRERRRR